MKASLRTFSSRALSERIRVFQAWVICVIALHLPGRPVLADGCFVFRWNKDIDIKEPTQKAIIVYDAGREDLLLQVKYEGPLEEFGWLIPVPSLPAVEKGSIQPFYELSQLTQQYGWVPQPSTLHGGDAAGAEAETPVKVIQIKTVGAYEISILSAKDAGSLESWLKNHGYSIPAGKTEIIDEYVHKGWYFVAAKIDLTGPVSFRRVSGAATKGPNMAPGKRSAIQKRLSSGELHPLRISFDSPHCIYPLRISAVAGKPSEISLYVLSDQALLDGFILRKEIKKLQQVEAGQDRSAREQQAQRRTLNDQTQRAQLLKGLYALAFSGDNTSGKVPDASPGELEALGREPVHEVSPAVLNTRFDDTAYGLVNRVQVGPQSIPACAQELPRLKGKSWYLTKQVCTFQAREMHDLELRSAVEELTTALAEPGGALAAAVLASWRPTDTSVLMAACRSSDAMQRINASSALRRMRGPTLDQLVVTLLKDKQPEVRLNAILAIDANWRPEFAEPLIALFADPYPQIRRQATDVLCLKEPASRTDRYLALLRSADPNVQLCALTVLSEISLTAVPNDELVHLLGSPRLETVATALKLLQLNQTLEFLARRRLMYPAILAEKHAPLLSSAQAAPLSTNQIAVARLVAVKLLSQNGDVHAISLILPLLRDTNAIVRNRAFNALQTLTGQNIPKNEPAKWEQWWAANKNKHISKSHTAKVNQK